MVKKCTIFSPPICDGCEDGYYIDPVNGCVECSPGCTTSEEEVRTCATAHDRFCEPRRAVPTTPVLSKFIYLALKQRLSQSVGDTIS